MNRPHRAHSLSDCLYDAGMVDQNSLQLFDMIGRMRSPFDGIKNWPWLDHAFKEQSEVLFHRLSEEEWQLQGGQYDEYGALTLNPVSQAAEELLQYIDTTFGGLLWTDSHGESWAVRLGSSVTETKDVRYGFCLPLKGAICNIDLLGGDELRIDREASRSRFMQVAASLRLYRRAEQLLWLFHSLVLKQCSSLIIVPNVFLGEAVWGPSDWPKDWQRDILSTLRSLTQIRCEVLRLGTSGWRPRLGLYSVLLAYYEQLSITRPRADLCHPQCPLHGTDRRHQHLQVQIGHGFLGVLEKFMSEKNGDQRQYNFQRTTNSEVRKARKGGGILNVNLLHRVLAPSKWSPFTRNEVQVLNGLITEITRDSKSSRPDKAAMLKDRRVPQTTPAKMETCPLLSARSEYISFNGNGTRKGCGYRLVGKNSRGWLFKCGFDISYERCIRIACRQWLQALGQLVRKLGLTVVALEPKSGAWHGLSNLILRSQRRLGWKEIDRMHIRIYAPLTYLDRLRELLSTTQQSNDNSAGHTEAKRGMENQQMDIDMPIPDQLRCAGLRHQDLADHLSVSRSYVTKLLNGQNRWTEHLLTQTEAFLRATDLQVCHLNSE